jgi:hypothetical protein
MQIFNEGRISHGSIASEICFCEWFMRQCSIRTQKNAALVSQCGVSSIYLPANLIAQLP